MDPELFFATIISLFLGALFGAFIYFCIHRIRLRTFKKLANQIVQNAEREAESLKVNAALAIQDEKVQQRQETEKLLQKEQRKIQKESERVQEREDGVERRMGLIEKKLSDIGKRETILIARKDQLNEEKKNLRELGEKALKELEQISGFSRQEAQNLLFDKMTQEVKTDAANLIRKLKKETEEEAEQIATSILTTAMNRLAVPCVSDATVSTVSLPNEEMKGRIIGREGRNIRALEHATGVNFLIDDTPGVVVVSGFDPIRRTIAKTALTDLISDGRIHPTRIEETVDKATKKIQKQIKESGEDAAFRIGAMSLHPELLTLLGKLKFRYSFGQNILDHSLEVSHLMGVMAEELGINSQLAKRIGLLHDIGKAVSHDVPGTHAIIGHDLALKYGEKSEVANGIGCHHEEMEPTTPEAALCTIADKLSASRPGARIEAVEEYIKRLRKLENIAFEFPGIEKAYAMQAGREVRIVVLPDMIDDDGIVNLARDLSKRIEKELDYPGRIKVTVIREKRVVDYAV